jgi:hypothetical protein
MQVVFHLGAHQTDHGQLLRSLLKNADLLLAEEVVVPGPSRYRKLIGELTGTLRGAEPDDIVQETLLEAVLDMDEPERLILSSDSFICVPERVLESGRLYNRAYKTAWLRALFPDCEPIFAMAMRNPATLLPALYASNRLKGVSYGEFIGGADPRAFRWSDTIARIREANPGVPLILWSNEDTPLVWGDILRALAGLPDDLTLEGEYDLLGQVMRRSGLVELARHIAETPRTTPASRRGVVLELLGSHLADDRLDVEIDLPGWTQDLVDEITALYDADVAAIRSMEGVSYLAP